ncbi:hypothetical protein GZ77_15180 [Endozoicomonas montiporae]|uniref:Uncharacterized protein n=2 Tax=Endozoicomonas montiporae TaxID=1027273 RepID=A0A081N5C5_9GAMM|nr:hypothetical protein [Endozoicomonas montiporae]AMO57468.1 hypothetical protein EZMO1_3482 [Endozoicomonas montiporae CL-33]KEQ13648.1 hypothetical protein GZ77_15180 [Endozoicomonas montiporae]
MHNVKRLICALMLLGSMPAFSQQMVKDYKKLKSAIENNHAPSGYIDLNHCTVQERLGGSPREQWSYQISFEQQFSINHRNGMILTTDISEELHNESADKATLAKRFATFSAWPDSKVTSSCYAPLHRLKFLER